MRAISRTIALVALALPLSACARQQRVLPPPLTPQAFSVAMAELADQPANHTGFVLDRSALQEAQNLLEQGGLDGRRPAAALSGISIDRYTYAQPAFFAPERMEALMAGYRAAGWKHLVNANQTPQNTAQPRTMVTDLWLHFSGANINSVTVLTRSARDMNVLQLTGDLRPLDLVHLSGHLGIPKVDPDAVMVPERR